MKKIYISKNLIFLFLLLVVLTVYLFYVFFPLQAKLEEMQTQHETNRQLLSIYQNVMLDKPSAEAEIAEMVKRVNLDVDVKTGELFTNVIKDAASATNVVLQSVSIEDKGEIIQTTVTGFNVKRYGASVTFHADKQTLLAFLKNLENNTKAAFYVDNVSITANAYTLQISMYCPVKQ